MIKKNLIFLTIFFLVKISFTNAQTDTSLQRRIHQKVEASIIYLNQKNAGGHTPPSPYSSPEQDCNSAIPVCQNTYSTTQSYSGAGNNNEIPSNSSCLATNEKNSVWYTFTTSSSGNLAFNITPNSSSDDYDFALYDISGANCSDIASGALTPVRCNYSATAGTTGLSSSGTNASEPASGSNQSSVLNTTTGHTYVLVISNYSSSQSGYTLDFSPGTASIFDVTPPTAQSVTAPCGSSSITFNASEQIKCSSVAANGSDFTVTGTGGPYTVLSAAGVNCGSNTAQITVTTSPALSGAGPWNINVLVGSDGNTLLDGCGNPMAPTTLAFTTSPSAVTISGPSTVCKGSTFALTASNGSAYNWTGAAVPAGQNAQQTVSVVATNAGTLNFSVQVTNGTCGVATGAHAVTVTDAPIANFNVTPSLTVCAGNAVTFTNTSTYPCSTGGLGLNQCTCGTFLCNATTNQGTFATYLWTFGDGGTTFYLGGTPTSAFSPSHTYNTPGTYNVSLTASGLINTCSNSMNQTITVLPSTPSLTISPSVTVCPTQSATLTVAGGSTFTWTPGATLNSTSAATVIATPAASIIYTVTSPGCSGNQTATVSVNVNGTAPVIGTMQGPSSVCNNATGVTYSVTNVVGATYVWSVPAGVTITSTPTNSNVINVDYATTAGTISVTATTACGTATASIVVSISTNLSLSVTPTNPSICTGGTTTLTASGAASYTWSPATGLNSTSGSVVTASPATNQVYTISGASGTCTGILTVTVTVIPSLIISINSPTVCAGSSATLTATSGASTYSWSPATGLSATTGSVVTATVSANTTYTVIGTAGTCSASTTTTITINAAPTVTTTSTTICTGSTGILTAGGASTYTWSTGSIGSTTTVNPTGNQTYTVTGTDVNTCTNTAVATVTVNTLPIITSSSISICTGNTGTLTASGATSYTWSTGSLVATTNVSPIVNQTYTVIGLGVNTCTNIAIGTVTVNPLPFVGVWNQAVTICAGASYTLAASGALTYTWSPTTGIVSGTNIGQNIVVSPTVATTYTVIGTDINGCVNAGGSISYCGIAVATSSITASGTVICNGSSGIINASGASTYTWSTGAVGASTTVNPVTTQNYTVNGTDNITGCAAKAVVTVTVNLIPVVSAISGSVCEGASITLIGSGANSYVWSTGASTAGISVNPTSTQNYTVIGTSLGCSKNAIATVTVVASPTITVNSGVACSGVSATLTATGGTAYSWNPPTGLSTIIGSTVIATPTNNQTYTVTGINAKGCTSMALAIVTVGINPVVSLAPTGLTGCAPQCMTYTATSITTGIYVWNFTPTETYTTTINTKNECFNTAGNYTVKVTLIDVNGCKGTAISSVSIYPVPIADFDYNPKSVSVLAPDVTFINESLGGAIIASNTWNFGDITSTTNTTSVTNPTHNYADTGSYNVTLTLVSTHLCKASIVKTIVVEPNYAIYVPTAFTPDGDGLNEVFVAVGEGIKDFKMNIFDRWGNHVFTSTNINVGWDGTYHYKNSEVQQDVYVWKIELTNYLGATQQLTGQVTLLK